MATPLNKRWRPLALGVSLSLISDFVYVGLVSMLSSSPGSLFILFIFLLFHIGFLYRSLHILRDFSPEVNEVLLGKSGVSILKTYTLHMALAIAAFIVICGFPFFFSKAPFRDVGEFLTLPFIFFWLLISGILIATFSGPEIASAIYVVRKRPMLGE